MTREGTGLATHRTVYALIRHIQALLGHASLCSTERYTHVAITKLQEVHARTHPAARVSAEPTPSRPAPEADPHGPERAAAR